MDLHFLRDVTAHAGPFATVYLDASHDTADAAQQEALRWSDARDELLGQGADTDTVDALGRVLHGEAPARGRAGRALVAAVGDVLLDRLLPAPPDRPAASWAPLPDLLPLLIALPEPITAVVVRIDETGGEILLARAGSSPRPAEEVVGPGYPVHQARGGGLSHLSMQERVVESWRRNTADVAGRVDARVSATAARVLVVAGDPPARSRLLEALSTRAAAIAVEVEHSGGTGDPEGLAAAVANALADAVNAERHAVLERYQQAAGKQEGFAVDGLSRVLAALRAEQVDTLLVDGATERDAEVWFAEVPTQVALDAEQLAAMGAEPRGRAAADAALVRAAAGGNAAFQPLGGGRTGLVGHDVADGVAALLRYPFVGE